MKNLELCHDWELQKAQLKQYFEGLTDGDLTFEKGKKQVMLDRIQRKLGKSREELHTILVAVEMSIQFSSVQGYRIMNKTTNNKSSNQQ